jgi:thiol-disulfide isomerase/thioredoxin
MTHKICSWVLFVFVGMAFSACNKNSGHAEIDAHVIASDEVIISEITPGEVVPRDTLVVLKNKFTYKTDITEPTFLLLEFSEGTKIPLLIMPGEKLAVDINDTTLFGTFSVKGSVGSAKMAEQRLLVDETARMIDSLDQQAYLLQDFPDEFYQKKKEWNVLLDAQLEKHRNKLREIIDRDTTDLSNIMAFYQSVGEIEILNFEDDRDHFLKVSRGLLAKYPDNAHVKYFNVQLQRYEVAFAKQLKIEETASQIVANTAMPDIVLPNPSEEDMALSSLKGKLVLVDFWASWCGPCRRANPELVRLYELYHSKGFEIFSVSLDGVQQQPNPLNDWRYAIEYDRLSWPYHVSDLKGFNSQVIETFGIVGIPFAILVDKNGKIIARDVRINELEALIKKHL